MPSGLLQAHVKPCPKCNVPVEKNGGCNLVVCRSCRQPFCWLCGAKTGTSHTWERIEGHTCGEWKAQRDKEIADSQARHKRYMHFYNHYQVRGCSVTVSSVSDKHSCLSMRSGQFCTCIGRVAPATGKDDMRSMSVPGAQCGVTSAVFV